MTVLNPATLIDGYKLDHRRQYPEGTQIVYSNWTPRDSRTAETEVVFFGLQYFLDRYLMTEWQDGFFDRPVEEVVTDYETRVNGYLGPNSIGADHVRALHNLGYLPLRFSAVPEGTTVPLRTPMLVVENTHEDFGWLVNYFETLMSSVLWMPCTSATTARAARRALDRYAEITGSPAEFVDWQGHDFSFRGMPGPEAAAMSGAGHLLYFTGTDTIPAIDFIERYYTPVNEDTFIAGSVAATEHSVMCAGGNDQDEEQKTFERLLDLYPSGIVSVVSDTWDLWNVLTVILPNLKDRIMARDGKLVVRPDSGDPVKIICGDENAPLGSPARKGVIELLWDAFGGTLTDKGYKLLDGHIGAIYGDSITQDRLVAILDGLEKKGFASANMVFGIGSFSYQYVTRDTYGFAMKATWVQINGEGKDIFKDPVTDGGVKKSAKGRLAVLRDGNDVITVNQATPEEEAKSILQPVWEDGEFLRFYHLEALRANARA
jgi:nicotinamide phosphoribosyltransferase